MSFIIKSDNLCEKSVNSCIHYYADSDIFSAALGNAKRACLNLLRISLTILKKYYI